MKIEGRNRWLHIPGSACDVLRPKKAWCRIVAGIMESGANRAGKGAASPQFARSKQLSAVVKVI